MGSRCGWRWKRGECLPSCLYLPALSLELFQYQFNFRFNLWYVTLDDVPDNLEIDIIITMDDAVPHPRHAFPRDIWIFLTHLLRQAFCCFANDFQGSYNRKIDPEIAFELRLAYPFEQGLSLVHTIQNVLNKIQELTAQGE
jgi:hypothetical protein